MRRVAKVDKGQAKIVKELRDLGYDVDHVHQVKKLYDLVVTGNPEWSLVPVALRVEIKTPGETLSPGEKEFWAKQKHKDNLIIAYSAKDILDWFGDDGKVCCSSCPVSYSMDCQIHTHKTCFACADFACDGCCIEIEWFDFGTQRVCFNCLIDHEVKTENEIDTYIAEGRK